MWIGVKKNDLAIFTRRILNAITLYFNYWAIGNSLLRVVARIYVEYVLCKELEATSVQ